MAAVGRLALSSDWSSCKLLDFIGQIVAIGEYKQGHLKDAQTTETGHYYFRQLPHIPHLPWFSLSPQKCRALSASFRDLKNSSRSSQKPILRVQQRHFRSPGFVRSKRFVVPRPPAEVSSISPISLSNPTTAIQVVGSQQSLPSTQPETDSRTLPASTPSHLLKSSRCQFIQRACHSQTVGSHCHMKIDLRRRDVLVAQQLLDSSEVNSGLQEMRRERMP